MLSQVPGAASELRQGGETCHMQSRGQAGRASTMSCTWLVAWPSSRLGCEDADMCIVLCGRAGDGIPHGCIGTGHADTYCAAQHPASPMPWTRSMDNGVLVGSDGSTWQQPRSRPGIIMAASPHSRWYGWGRLSNMGRGRLVAPALHSAAREAKEAKEALRTLVGSSRAWCRQAE